MVPIMWALQLLTPCLLLLGVFITEFSRKKTAGSNPEKDKKNMTANLSADLEYKMTVTNYRG